MNNTKIFYFKEIASQTETVFATFINMLDVSQSVTVEMRPAYGNGNVAPQSLPYACVVPEEVLMSGEGSSWMVSLHTSPDEDIAIDIYTVPVNFNSKIKELKDKLKIMQIKNDIMRAAIDGKAITSGDGQTVEVYDKDNVIIQRLKIVNGIRTPEKTDVFFEIINGEYEVSTEAVLVDGVWVTELAQYSELEGGSK
jgi:hypothetical protein